MPDAQVQQIWDHFEVRSFTGLQIPFIDCAYREKKGDGYSLDFQFKGKTIRVPMSEMVVDAFATIQDTLQNDSTLKKYFDGWDGVCMFGVGSAKDYGITTDNFALLGDTFLRSAYVVYDLKNEQLGLAQANLNSTNTKISEMSSNATSFPVTTGATQASSDDDDNAAGHVAPRVGVAAFVTLMTIGGAVMTFL